MKSFLKTFSTLSDHFNAKMRYTNGVGDMGGFTVSSFGRILVFSEPDVVIFGEKAEATEGYLKPNLV